MFRCINVYGEHCIYIFPQNKIGKLQLYNCFFDAVEGRHGLHFIKSPPLSKIFSVYEMSYLWNVLSIKCLYLWNVFIYEMSYLWCMINVVFEKLSYVSHSHVTNLGTLINVLRKSKLSKYISYTRMRLQTYRRLYANRQVLFQILGFLLL